MGPLNDPSLAMLKLFYLHCKGFYFALHVLTRIIKFFTKSLFILCAVPCLVEFEGESGFQLMIDRIVVIPEILVILGTTVGAINRIQPNTFCVA